jgi:nitroreductase
MSEQTTQDPSTRAAPFPDALLAAAGIAALSPSSHNCQPWAAVRLAGPGARRAADAFLADSPGETEAPLTGDCGDCEYLALALDRDRALDALPAHAVEMLLSCGLYGQLLLRALAAHGWAPARIRHQDTTADAGLDDLVDTWPRNLTPLCVIELRRTAPTRDLAALRTAALARRTNRAPYRPDPVAPDLLARLAEPADALAGGSAITIRHLSEAVDRDRFAAFVARHGGRDFAHDRAWRETYSFIRRNDAEARAQGDGFALSQLFGPLSPIRGRILHTALAPRTMRLLRHLGYPRLLAGQLAAVVRPTPVLVMMSLTAADPTAGDTVRAGARLAEYWLRATRAGLTLHPVSSVLQHDDLRGALQDRFDLPGQAFFASRLGYPTAQFPAAPRRPAAEALYSI